MGFENDGRVSIDLGSKKKRMSSGLLYPRIEKGSFGFTRLLPFASLQHLFFFYTEFGNGNSKDRCHNKVIKWIPNTIHYNRLVLLHRIIMTNCCTMMDLNWEQT